jgi:hypothetical protein
MRALRCFGRNAWLALLIGACAAPRPQARDAAQGGDELPVLTAERAPPARSAGDRAGGLGFVLESTLRARRIREGQPPMFLELGNGDTVIDGDRLQVHLRTSQEAYLYVAFCSQKARDPRYPGLKVFPEQGAIRALPYEVTVVPDRKAEIVLDDQPGQETMYLILSRAELSSSDAGLAQVLAAARQGRQSADCGTSFRTAVAGSRNKRQPSGVWSGKLQGRERPKPSPAATTVAPPQAGAGDEPDPVVEIQRGGDIVWNNGVSMGLEADTDGVVVLRYRLTHVAAPP